MEVSGAIRKLLDKAAICVGPEPLDKPVSGVPLRMVLLADQGGRLQVICRQDDLLDLVELSKQLGRQLRLISDADYSRFLKQADLQQIPAIPGLTGWPTLIDRRVADAETLVIEPVGKNVRMTLTQAEFRLLAGAAEERACCVPVARIDAAPHSPEQDQKQVFSAIERFTSLRIRQRLEDTLELPPLPETARRIIQLRVNPNANMLDLVDIVESDPSLAAQVVSWASSSFYAAAGQVRSVHDAVARILGFDLVMNLAMGLSLGQTLKQPEYHPRGVMGYWQQSVWQAQAAGVLASQVTLRPRPVFGLAYLAGLLHNFGYLVLSHVFPPHFRLACLNWEANPHLDTAVVEQHLLGVTREQLAAELMANWYMPDQVTVALRYQKAPSFQGEHDVYPRLLWLGRQLLNERGLKLGPSTPIPESAYQELGLDREKVARAFDELVASRDSIMTMAGAINAG